MEFELSMNCNRFIYSLSLSLSPSQVPMARHSPAKIALIVLTVLVFIATIATNTLGATAGKEGGNA